MTHEIRPTLERLSDPAQVVAAVLAIDARNVVMRVGLLRWLDRDGLSAADVRLTEIPFAQMLGSLERGTVDAAAVPKSS